jgi:hypothetical protein|tara:strand:+ start:871 stop:1095 length:225 start_codon:yes stop_codon:yes gene_type:complete
LAIKKEPEGSLGFRSSPQIYIGWKRRSGKKRLNSIKIPAVAVNQMAATTGAAVKNLFIVEGAMVESGDISAVRQ